MESYQAGRPLHLSGERRRVLTDESGIYALIVVRAARSSHTRPMLLWLLVNVTRRYLSVTGHHATQGLAPAHHNIRGGSCVEA